MRQVLNSDSNHVPDERERFVMHVASATARGIKEASSKQNIRQTADLVNGLMFAGLLIEKNTPDDNPGITMSFVDSFKTRAPYFRRIIERNEFEDAEETKRFMSSHQIGVADLTPSDMLINVGISTENIVEKVGTDYGLSKNERLDIISFSIVLMVVADTAPEFIDDVMSGVTKSLETKTAVWNETIPSDAEMFGDDEEDE